MKLFKSIDQKFKEEGFEKVEEDRFGVSYEKFILKYNYTHVIDIVHKKSGNCIIQSYEKEVNENGLNNACGLTYFQAKLCIQKMKKIGFNKKYQ